MITIDRYEYLVKDVINKDIAENKAQESAILAPLSESQHIIAGPGSGKTTVLVLKILKYIFVDDIKPDEIIVTTFTKKAASQLKERTISWGESLLTNLKLNQDINFDNILIGTLDSIAEDILNDIKDITVIDNFTSSAIMMQIFLTDERNKDKKLKQFFKRFKDQQSGLNTSDMNKQIQEIRERIYYDLVDKSKLKDNADREKLLYTFLDEYYLQLKNRNIYDYALLEYEFYNSLKNIEIKRLKNVSVLLIDEYQDTNLLQEQIYFEMIKYVKSNNGNVTVVGDEDQALYRFRGATINLFTDYIERIKKQLGLTPKKIYLQKNYRSTENIINFTNEYVHLDDTYQKARTTNKPSIIKTNDTIQGLPVMGMFRNNIMELSTDLSNLVYDLKTNKDHVVVRNGKKYNIKTNKKNPSIALLMNSPREITAYNNKRLPYYLRDSLSYKDPIIPVFNPRGQDIESTEIVSIICGLLLINIDSKGIVEQKIENIPPHTKKTIKLWRKQGEAYVSEHDISLLDTSEIINLSELLNDIIKEVKPLLDETPENKVYADIIFETINQTNNAINEDEHLTPNQIFWHILVPIATGAIDIDDDMFDANMDDTFNIMSIHQAKGLEFDIIIVDVGSDIKNKSRNNAFKRYPLNGGKTYQLEHYLREYSPLSEEYKLEQGLNNAFDDIIRRYFVAYTRPKSILILVGLNSMRYGYRGDFQDNILIPSVATGWTRDNKWHWDKLNNLLQL